MNTSDCADCGVDVCPVDGDDRAEFFMVYDDVWAAAGITPDGGYLCVGCIETRLGRHLDTDDFTNVPMNDLGTADTYRYAWSWRTPRLVNRLTTNRKDTTA